MITLKAFKRSLLKLFPQGVPSRVAIALSGGVDSMALSFLLSQYMHQNYQNHQLLAITVDHQLRPESSTEAASLQGYVRRRLNIEHTIGKLQWTRQEMQRLDRDFEKVARTKRYRCIKQICQSHNIDTLFVGHNLDDQIETYLLRKKKLPRSEGQFASKKFYLAYLENRVFGECGISTMSYLSADEAEVSFLSKPCKLTNYKTTLQSDLKLDQLFGENDAKQVIIYRPLLDFYKKDLIQTCETNNVTWFQDNSNFDPEITERNKIRHELAKTSQHEVPSQIIVNISKNRQKVAQFQSQIEIISNKLAEKSWLVYHPELLSISIKFPTSWFLKYSSPVINRFFYQKLSVISASKKYHYKFMKMYDFHYHVSEFSQSDMESRSFSYLNMKFQIRKSEETEDPQLGTTNDTGVKNNVSKYLYMEIYRQSMKRQQSNTDFVKEIQLAHNTISDWINYDNRFFFKVQNSSGKSKSLLLRPYVPQTDKQSLAVIDDKKLVKELSRIIIKYQLPVLECTATKRILGVLPIYFPEGCGLNVGWSTKDDMFSLSNLTNFQKSRN